jgi:hypothetical protein
LIQNKREFYHPYRIHEIILSCFAILTSVKKISPVCFIFEHSLTFFEDYVRLLAGKLTGEDPALLADLGKW